MSSTALNAFMTEAVIRKKPVHWFAGCIDWFLYDNGLRHERVKYRKTGIIVCCTLRANPHVEYFLTLKVQKYIYEFVFHQNWNTSIFDSSTWNIYHLGGDILVLAFLFSLIHFLVLGCQFATELRNRIVAQSFNYFISKFCQIPISQNIFKAIRISRQGRGW